MIGCLPYLLGIDIQQEKTNFQYYTTAASMVLGVFLLFIYSKQAPKAKKRWDEMEGIRKNIDEEFDRRDKVLHIR